MQPAAYHRSIVMLYHAIHSSEPAELYLFTTLQEALARGRKTLWFVSGGSTIALAVTVAAQLRNHPNIANLTVMQTDERYGKLDHNDANWHALKQAGFDCGKATCLPILHGKSLAETTQDYDTALAGALQENQFKVGLFGIGEDGHTAGILPGSPAAAETRRLVVGYDAPDFTRVTITGPAIARFDMAVVYAVGQNKAPALITLQQKVLPITEQPAQALKQVKDVDIYTDCKGVDAA